MARKTAAQKAADEEKAQKARWLELTTAKSSPREELSGLNKVLAEAEAKLSEARLAYVQAQMKLAEAKAVYEMLKSKRRVAYMKFKQEESKK